METRSDRSLSNHERLEALFHEHGFKDFKWIEPEKIIVSQWVRVKCMFGCGEYSKTASCPANVPSVSECENFFHEYNNAVIFHFEKKLAKPEDRFAWTRKVNLSLSRLEEAVFFSGYEKTLSCSWTVAAYVLSGQEKEGNAKSRKYLAPLLRRWPWMSLPLSGSLVIRLRFFQSALRR